MNRMSFVTPFLPWRGASVNATFLVILIVLIPWAVTACPQDCVCFTVEGGGSKVSCRHQNLASVPSDLPLDTVDLDMGYNQLLTITSETFPSLPLLTNLTLDRSWVRELRSKSFSPLPNLQRLILSNNQITDIHPETFNGLANLRILHLDYNQIKSLPPSVFRELSLEKLLLHSNGLESLDDNTFEGTSIVNLNLDENNISNISMELLTPLKQSLKNFNLSHNQQPLIVEENVFSGFNFSDLKITYAGLKDSSFLKHIQAHSLDISGQQFARLDFRDWDNLRLTEEIYLRNLSIVNLNDSILANLVSVRLLDLSQNQLISLDGEVFRLTPELRVLRLDHNLFMSLPEDLGTHLRKLEVLKVPWNRLAVVRPDAFAGMNSLRELDLRYNLIQVMDESMRTVLVTLDSLMMAGNPLHCNCEMRWYRQWLDEYSMDTGANDCHSPAEGFIYSIPAEDFVCRAAEVTYITDNMNAMEGEDVYLTCKAEGDPAPQVQWSSPLGEIVSVTPPFNRTKYSTYAIWHISRIQSHQGGWFPCVASNRKGRAEKAVYIHVVQPGESTIDVNAVTRPTTPTTPTSTTQTTTTPTSTTQTTTTPKQPSTPPETTTTTPISTSTTTVTTEETTATSTTSAIREKSTSRQVAEPPDDKRSFPAWYVAVIVGCILGAIMLFTVIGVCVHQAVRKKYHRKYDVSCEGDVPMVSNNNSNSK